MKSDTRILVQYMVVHRMNCAHVSRFVVLCCGLVLVEYYLYPADTWRYDNVIMTSKQRCASFWRNDDVIITSCIHWVLLSFMITFQTVVAILQFPPVKQWWRIWVLIQNTVIKLPSGWTTKQNTAKQCAYSKGLITWWNQTREPLNINICPGINLNPAARPLTKVTSPLMRQLIVETVAYVQCISDCT